MMRNTRPRHSTRHTDVTLALGTALLLALLAAPASAQETGITTDTRANHAAPDMGAAPDAYVPTSAWVEPGADTSDVTEISFTGGADSAGVGLSDRSFTRTMNSHSGELMACYLKGLKRDPNLRGRVRFQFRIAPDGHVSIVRVVNSGLRSKRVEDCFVEAARAWTFPSSATQSRFTTEMAFFLD